MQVDIDVVKSKLKLFSIFEKITIDGNKHFFR